MPNFISEDQIEKAILNILTTNLRYRHINCYTQDAANLNDQSSRSSKNEVILFNILKTKVKALNPDMPETIIDEAIIRLTNKRYAMSPVLANKEVYSLIREAYQLNIRMQKAEQSMEE